MIKLLVRLLCLTLVVAWSATSAKQSCSPPYKVRTDNGRCVWSCGPGTQPDPATDQCQCQDGLIDSGRDKLKRRICTEDDGLSRDQIRFTPPVPAGVPAAKGLKLPGDNRAQPALKIPTRIDVADLDWVRGQSVSLLAVINDRLGNALHGVPLSFDVAGRRVCRARSDGFGRAECAFEVPFMNFLPSYTVTVSFTGSASHGASTGTGTLRINTGRPHSGRLDSGQAVRIHMGAFDGVLDTQVRLRAKLYDGDAPVSQGLVEFRANGVPVGRARTNAAGIAKLQWRPRHDHLDRLFDMRNAETNEHQGYIGGFQAWYLPGSDSPHTAVAIIAQGVLRPSLANRLCERYSVDGQRSDSRQPVRCSSHNYSGARYTLQGQGFVEIQRSRFGHARSIQNPRYRVEVPEPPQPAPNPDCDASLVDVRGACRRSCARLEYITYQDSGSIDAAAIGQRPARCAWPLEREHELSEQLFKDAHDACALHAASHGLARWNHRVNITDRLKLTGHFQFRDPHTRRVEGDWHYHLQMEHVFRTVWIDLPVVARCVQ